MSGAGLGWAWESHTGSESPSLKVVPAYTHVVTVMSPSNSAFKLCPICSIVSTPCSVAWDGTDGSVLNSFFMAVS